MELAGQREGVDYMGIGIGGGGNDPKQSKIQEVVSKGNYITKSEKNRKIIKIQGKNSNK